jgi:hypothetical protein
MSIEPDTKDWTWVLQRRCPECGFDASTTPFAEIPDLIRNNAAAWPAVLARSDAGVRPAPDRWSALEYACHVRDVFRLYDTRLHLMLDEDEPTFPNWDQDATAEAEHYGDQDPQTVASELAAAADALAASFAEVANDDLARTGTRSDGATFTVESFARYLIHDPVHHLWDVGSGISS